MIIRPMEPEDADSVAQIEKDSFTQPWSRLPDAHIDFF